MVLKCIDKINQTNARKTKPVCWTMVLLDTIRALKQLPRPRTIRRIAASTVWDPEIGATVVSKWLDFHTK